MANEREVVVLSGVRTAIGSYGGGLKDQPPTELAAAVVREAVAPAGVEPKEVGHVVFGNVIHTDPHDMYLARVAGVKGGLPVETPALTLNRLCGSGLQAIITASQAILLGDADAAVAGGAENMSRSPYLVPAMRWGARMNDATMIDVMVGALSDPFDDCHMGVTAENVASKYRISREDQDKLAAEKLARLKPVFDANGTVTAGNASSINDAAAAVVLMERGAAERRGLQPMGRLVDYAYAGGDPKDIGVG